MLGNQPYSRINSFSQRPSIQQCIAYILFLMQILVFSIIIQKHLSSRYRTPICAVYGVVAGVHVCIALAVSFSDPSDNLMIKYRNDRSRYTFKYEVSSPRKLGTASTVSTAAATSASPPVIAESVADVLRTSTIIASGLIIVWGAKTIGYSPFFWQLHFLVWPSTSVLSLFYGPRMTITTILPKWVLFGHLELLLLWSPFWSLT